MQPNMLRSWKHTFSLQSNQAVWEGGDSESKPTQVGSPKWKNLDSENFEVNRPQSKKNVSSKWRIYCSSSSKFTVELGNKEKHTFSVAFCREVTVSQEPFKSYAIGEKSWRGKGGMSEKMHWTCSEDWMKFKSSISENFLVTIVPTGKRRMFLCNITCRHYYFPGCADQWLTVFSTDGWTLHRKILL